MDGWVEIGVGLDTKQFDKQINDVQETLEGLEKEYEYLKKSDPFNESGLKQYEVEIEKTKNKIIALRKQQERANKPKDILPPIDIEPVVENTTAIRNDLPTINDITKTIEKNTARTIKQVGQWALAIFSVRTAYNLVQKASSTLTQYDKQYATDLQYISFVLSQMLAPILKYVVSLAYQLMSYVMYLAKAWFGFNRFADASAKNFKSMSNSTKSIKKDLQGFDEMNVLNDTTSSSGADIGGMPNIDLGQMQGKVPSWLQWIADNGDFVLSIVAGIATAIGASKLGLDAIQSIGIGVTIFGVINFVKDLIGYLKDPTFEKFGKVLMDIGVILTGLGIAFLGWQAVVVGVIVAIVGYVISHKDKVVEILGKFWEWFKKKLDAFGYWCDDAGEKIQGFFSSIVDFIGNIFSSIGNFVWGVIKGIFDIFVSVFNNIKEYLYTYVKAFISIFDGIRTGFKQIFDGVLMIFQGDFANGFKSIGKGIANIFIGIINGAIDKINYFLPKISSIINSVGSALNFRVNVPSSLPKVQYLASGGIINKPGQGIPIGGESGAEGVIPLTDSQAMNQLGEAIGRYITINANIVNKMNGRTLSRELVKVQNDNNFAFNV